MLNFSPERQNLIYLAFFTSFSVIEKKEQINCGKMQGLGSTSSYKLTRNEVGSLVVVHIDTNTTYTLRPTEYGFILLNIDNKPIIDIKRQNQTAVTIISLETGDIFNVKRIDHKVEIVDAFAEETVPVEMASVTC